MIEMHTVADVRTLVYRLHGYWISQDFSNYEENRKYLDSIIQQYDTITLKQMIFYIEYEIKRDIYKLSKLDIKNEKSKREKIMTHKIAFKALHTILQKSLAPRLAIIHGNNTYNSTYNSNR